MNKIQALKVFVTIVKFNSIRRAADHLDFSSTMASRYLKMLESDVGCRLINRNTRQLSLTEAGKQYHDHALRIIDLMQQADLELQNFNQQPKGKLTVSASVEFGSQYLAPFINSFLIEYPDIDLNIELTNEPVNLFTSNIDIAIRVAPTLLDSGLIAQPLINSRLSCWCSPKFYRNIEPILVIDDLNPHPLLQFNHDSRPDSWIFNIDNQLLTKTFNWHWRSNSGRLLNEAAVQGQGIIQAPNYSVAQYVKNGQLIEVLSQAAVDPLPISAVYRHKSAGTIAIKAFVAKMKLYFQEQKFF